MDKSMEIRLRWFVLILVKARIMLMLVIFVKRAPVPLLIAKNAPM